MKGSRNGGMFEYRNLDYDTTSVDPIVIQNKVYTALEETANVKAYYLIVEQINNGAAVETIQLDLILAGTTHVWTQVNQVDSTEYYLYFDKDGVLVDSNSVVLLLSLGDVDQSAPLETRSMEIQVRQTTPVDAVAAQIDVNMVYATKEF